ncbi:MAG: hypothetical protein KDD19_09630 [Phaeodactylibacter sp.]|nr:hypothetical protein [Phaeodactylibacter sp.]MCB9050561.1 hypothetical protein [Lewinellaceae bacterium]
MLGTLICGTCFSAILMASCVNTTFQEEPVTGNVEREEPMIKFKAFSYIDAQGTGGEAFRFLMPSDWKFEGGITWILDLPAMPATAAFKVYNPNGAEAFEAFSNRCFFWTDNQFTLGLNPPGSRYFGMEVRPPLSAVDALQQIVLWPARGNRRNLQVISADALPELARAVGAGKMGEGYVQSFGDGARLRITYEEGGVQMEEEIYGVVEGMYFPIQSMYGTTTNIIWYMDYLFSFKARQGELKNNASIFQTITSSFRLNPQWYARYSNMIEYLAQQQIQRIHSIGELSRMLSQMSDQMRSENLAQFEARGKAFDQGAQNFSDYMLNIDRYYDPFEEREVELPSGYNHAWVNNLGEYILSDDPNFNPNVGSNLHWENMKRN